MSAIRLSAQAPLLPVPTALRGPLTVAAEKVEFLALCGVALLIPLVLGHSQLLTGTVVNFALILGALHFRSWARLAPLIFLPALAAVAGAAFFGGFEASLLLIVPVVWAGNACLVWVIRRTGGGLPYSAALPAAAGLKAAVIFAGLCALVVGGLMPAAVLWLIAPLQLFTVLMGGLLVIPADKVIRSRFAGGEV